MRVTSRTAQETSRPCSVLTGLRLISAGKTRPFLVRPNSLRPEAIDRNSGAAMNRAAASSGVHPSLSLPSPSP